MLGFPCAEGSRSSQCEQKPLNSCTGSIYGQPKSGFVFFGMFYIRNIDVIFTEQTTPREAAK